MMKTKYLISFLFVFMLMQQFIFGQDPNGQLGNSANNSNLEVEFECKYSGVDLNNPESTREFFLLGNVSPVSSFAASPTPTSYSDFISVQANSVVTFYIQILDVDISCVTNNGILGEGPYRIEFEIIDANGAFFLANQGMTYTVNNILNQGNSGQVDVQIPANWNGSSIQIKATLIDLEELGDNCSASCGTQDPPTTITWALFEASSGCPTNLNIISITSEGNPPSTNFFTNHPLPVELQVQALPSANYDIYISEEIDQISPTFSMSQITQEWRDNHPNITTPQDVLNMHIMPANFAGGGFALEGGGFVDTYAVGENVLPFDPAALQVNSGGFRFTHKYFCEGEKHSHDARFFFNSSAHQGSYDIDVSVRISQ